eukprot:364266-Chlamydomonas_euryale.AAC.6
MTAKRGREAGLDDGEGEGERPDADGTLSKRPHIENTDGPTPDGAGASSEPRTGSGREEGQAATAGDAGGDDEDDERIMLPVSTSRAVVKQGKECPYLDTISRQDSQYSASERMCGCVLPHARPRMVFVHPHTLDIGKLTVCAASVHGAHGLGPGTCSPVCCLRPHGDAIRACSHAWCTATNERVGMQRMRSLGTCKPLWSHACRCGPLWSHACQRGPLWSHAYQREPSQPHAGSCGAMVIHAEPRPAA